MSEDHDLIELELLFLFLQIKTDMRIENENIELHLDKVEAQLLEEEIRRMWLRNELPIYEWNLHKLPRFLLDELKTYQKLLKEIDAKIEKVKTMNNTLVEKIDKVREFKERCRELGFHRLVSAMEA